MAAENMTEMQYSIWLVPNKGTPQRQLLDRVIAKLASDKRLEGFNSSPNDHPIFVPHVTLLSDIKGDETEVIAKSKELAQQLSPQTLTFNLFDYDDNLYQTLVIRAILAQETIEANKVARDIFSHHTDVLLNPHMSLLYQAGLDNAVKKSMIEELKAEGLIPSPNSPLVIPVDNIQVWTSPKPDNIPVWKEVVRFPFGK